MAYHLLHDYDNALQVLDDFRKTLTVNTLESIHNTFKQCYYYFFSQYRNPAMTMSRVSFYSTCIRLCLKVVFIRNLCLTFNNLKNKFVIN